MCGERILSQSPGGASLQKEDWRTKYDQDAGWVRMEAISILGSPGGVGAERDCRSLKRGKEFWWGEPLSSGTAGGGVHGREDPGESKGIDRRGRGVGHRGPGEMGQGGHRARSLSRDVVGKD